MIFVFSLLFQREQHLSPLQTGLALAPVMVAVTVANLASGSIAQRLGPRAAVAGGAVLVAAGCAGLLGIDAGTGYAAVVAQMFALGFGCGVIVPTITSELLGSVERSWSGVAAGTLNTLRQAGSAIGVALFGSLIASGFITGLHAALAMSVGLVVVIGGLAALLAGRRRPRVSAVD